jgi:5'-3' exonuclease
MAKFICENKECVNTEVNEISEFFISIQDNGKTVYKGKNKKPITCPFCGSNLQTIKEKSNGFTTFIATFDSKSPAEKKEILKKRADNEYKRNREMRERKIAADRGEV